MRHDQKLTNPKDHIGSSKLHLDLVPDSMVVFAAMGFLEGALKYGKYNWRAAGVRLSIYIAALERHKAKFMAGEWADPKTKVPHLASMIACLGIVVDAHVSGKLNDDRPPTQPNLSLFIDEQGGLVAHLKELFSDCNPHQHTIGDAVGLHRAADVSRNKILGVRNVDTTLRRRHDTRRKSKARR